MKEKRFSELGEAFLCGGESLKTFYIICAGAPPGTTAGDFVSYSPAAFFVSGA
jgi:hypothetical protein